LMSETGEGMGSIQVVLELDVGNNI